MIPRPNGSVLINLGLLAGMVLIACGAVYGAAALIEARSAELAERWSAIEVSSQNPEVAESSPPSTRDLLDLQELLQASQGMLANESRRVVELSSVAQAAGVTLVAIRPLEPTASEDGRILRGSHQLSVEGGFQQVAAFLDGLNGAEGTVGIEHVLIESRDDSSTDTLTASCRVTWFARGPDASALALNGTGR